MLKKLVLISGTIAAVSAVIIVFVTHRKININEPMSRLVAERGAPTFLAISAGVVTRNVKALRIQVPALDPKTVTDWNTVTNLIAIWAESEACKRNARYFYDEMKNDKSFDGGGWYSSQSPFGERLIVVEIDGAGIGTKQKKLHVDAVAIHLAGFVQPKLSAHRDP